MRTCSPLTMRRPPPIGSPHRGILCVEKIGSVPPELQERPGTPGKPVKSTNCPFYWLTRKRAPPCRWTPVAGPLLGDPCKNRVRAGIGGWPGTATGGQIHVVHISHTHPTKEIIQALRKYLLGKKSTHPITLALKKIRGVPLRAEKISFGWSRSFFRVT